MWGRGHMVGDVDIIWYVLICDHRINPVTRLCPVRVNPGNAGMGVWASQHLSINHARQPQVICEYSLASNNIICYDAFDFLSNCFVFLVHPSLLPFST